MYNITANATNFTYTVGYNTMNPTTTLSTYMRTMDKDPAGYQDIFLLWTTTKLTRNWNTFTSNLTIISLTAGNTSIAEAFFVTNSSSSIVALMSHTGGNYSIRFYNNATMQS